MPVYQFFLIGFIILIGFLAHLFFRKTNIPAALFLISLGLVLGPISGYFYEQPLVPAEPFRAISGLVTTLALIIILLDSGFDFDIFNIARTFPKAVFFTIVTFFATTMLVSLFMFYAVGWPILAALLLGVVSSGTTTVTVSHLVQHLRMRTDTKQLLILESVINDVTIVTGGVIIAQLIAAKGLSAAEISIADITSTLFGSVMIATAGGAIFFYIWLRTLDFTKESQLKFAYTLALLFLMYDAIQFLNGSGPIAVLIFSLLVGNSHRIMKRMGLEEHVLKNLSQSAVKSIKQVLGDVAFFVKAFFFVFLGVMFSPSTVTYGILAIVSGIILLIIAGRYFSARILSWRYQEFSAYRKIISIMLPRGFVATVVAFLPGEMGVEVPGFTEIILLMVLATNVIATIGAVAYSKTHSFIPSEKASVPGRSMWKAKAA